MSGLESRSCQRSQTAVQSGVKLDCPKQSTQLSQLCRWTLRPVRPKGQTMVRRNFRGAPRARPCTAPTTYARSHPHRPSQAIQLRVSSPRGRTWTGRTTAVWVSTLPPIHQAVGLARASQKRQSATIFPHLSPVAPPPRARTTRLAATPPPSPPPSHGPQGNAGTRRRSSSAPDISARQCRVESVVA